MGTRICLSVCYDLPYHSILCTSNSGIEIRFDGLLVTVKRLRCSFDVLNAVVWGKSSACGFPTDGTLDELDYRRDHLVHRANSLEERISFSGCGH